MTPPVTPSDRLEALDFTKGALIVIMVVYHWGIYFLGTTVPYFYDLLRFLTPSFIFITGAIIGLLQVRKYGLNDRRMYTRLAVRGAKLVLLFTGLNVGIQILLPGKSRSGAFGLPSFYSDVYNVYITGNSYSASFKVLLPIGYLLLFSIIFLQLLRLPRTYIIMLAATGCAILQISEFVGFTSQNLMLFSFGLLGLTLACVGLTQINRLALHTFGLVVCFSVYVIAMVHFGPFYWVQLIGVTLSLLLIYGFALRATGHGFWNRSIVFLGRYSLFAYIIQIGILQVLLALSRRSPESLSLSCAALPLAVAFTLAGTYLLALARNRSTLADRFYRGVFA